MPEGLALANSFAHCRGVARKAARNFYYGFRLLPPEKHDALCALYAFMRGVDDISDEPGNRMEKMLRLAERRAAMDRALAGKTEGAPIWAAFRHTVTRYGIPARYLHDLISGAEMDLTGNSYETFDRLREYCYRVAGTVGLCCVYVFGFSDPRAPELAETLGIAFQLTNILRDIAKDFRMGRVYLPQEDLARFGCGVDELYTAPASPNLRALVKFEVERAWGLYREGWNLISLVNEDSRAALWALARIYSGILEKIEARNFDALAEPPARLSAAEKVWILARARLGWRGNLDALRKRNRDWRRTGGAFLRRRAG